MLRGIFKRGIVIFDPFLFRFKFWILFLKIRDASSAIGISYRIILLWNLNLIPPRDLTRLTEAECCEMCTWCETLRAFYLLLNSTRVSWLWSGVWERVMWRCDVKKEVRRECVGEWWVDSLVMVWLWDFYGITVELLTCQESQLVTLLSKLLLCHVVRTHRSRSPKFKTFAGTSCWDTSVQ